MANGEDVEAPNPVLAEEVERVFEARRWKSVNQAEMKTGIPASTIRRMRMGMPVKAATVVRFGEAVGEDRERWGRVAVGLPAEPAGISAEAPMMLREKKAGYDMDPAEAALLEIYRRANETQKRLIRTVADCLLQDQGEDGDAGSAGS